MTEAFDFWQVVIFLNSNSLTEQDVDLSVSITGRAYPVVYSLSPGPAIMHPHGGSTLVQELLVSSLGYFVRRYKDCAIKRWITKRWITKRRITKRRISKHWIAKRQIAKRQITKRQILQNVESYKTLKYKTSNLTECWNTKRRQYKTSKMTWLGWLIYFEIIYFSPHCD